MAAVCFYFQLHQPYRLRRYSVFDTDSQYLDTSRNQKILTRVVEKCYLPSTTLLLNLIKRYEGRFKVSFSLTGVIIEQLREYAPNVIDQFRALADTGCVEFLGETYYHSLAFLYSRDEFKAQVDLHQSLIQKTFGQTPTVFRNTELIYANELAGYLHGWNRYTAILSEGADHILGSRSPNQVYHPPGHNGLKLLLKNYRLSDDIAFRFSNRAWSHWPLTVEKFAKWITEAGALGPVCNLFMDLETFGEHQWAETGIFDFLGRLPQAILSTGNTFTTPGEIAKTHSAKDVFDVPHMISWADTERDVSAWLGNAMQSNALHELYRMEAPAKATKDPAILRDWRNLTCSDHFYYMCTKYFADGDVHKYFNPYESPYDSYINFMNVLDNLRTRIDAAVDPNRR